MLLVHDKALVLGEFSGGQGRLTRKVNHHCAVVQGRSDLFSAERVKTLGCRYHVDFVSVIPDPERGLDAYESAVVKHNDLHSENLPCQGDRADVNEAPSSCGFASADARSWCSTGLCGCFRMDPREQTGGLAHLDEVTVGVA